MTRLDALVGTSQRVTAAAGRRAKVTELAQLLHSLAPEEIEAATHYLSGTLRQGRIGVGYSQLQTALPDITPPESTLTINNVDEVLGALQATRGAGSAARRTALLRGLFARATQEERDFLMRLLTGALRQGAMGGLMIEATAAAARLPVQQVRRAAMYARDLGTLARRVLEDGSAGLARFSLELFSPVAPMLAQTAADPAAALLALTGEVAFEWKLDGARIQLHKRGTEVRIFTRNLNEVTDAVPEIATLARSFPADILILDGEAIAMDAGGRPHPFQVTMSRFGRKLEVERASTALPLQAFFFDCLLKDGHSVVDLSGRERHELLVEAVPADRRVPRLVTSSPTDAESFYQAALATGHEGVMAKSLDAPYEAGNRGASWLKIKRAHTLDLVVLAAEWGHGRRIGKLSNLHLGAFDGATGRYTMLGKTFKGLTDALLEWQTRELRARETRRDAGTVWVRPELVVEVAFSDLQASTRYPGGVALRLARVKRYRTDKTPEQADTMQTVRRLFQSQRSGTGALDETIRRPVPGME